MLPLGGLFAFLARQLGRVLNMAFAWATTALFGQVPRDKALVVSGMALGSLLWPVVLAAVAIPSVATFMLAFVTLPEWLEPWVRPVMLALAVLLPLGVGVLGSRLESQPPSGAGIARAAFRGFPTAAGLFIVLLWMLVLAPIEKLRAILRRWESAHVPIAVKPRGYDTVARDLADALRRAGIETEACRAGWPFEVPGRVLAVLGGERVRRLVPEKLLVLHGKDVQIVIHPADLSLQGKRKPLARSRAAIARELTFTEANQTWSKEAQQIEDALVAASQGRADLGEIGRRIESAELEYEEWGVLYRLLMQVRLRTSDVGTDAVVAEREPAQPLGARLAALLRALAAFLPGGSRQTGKRSPTG
ncbi:hypothetical protein BH18CHL2_BH18CHL2_06990 [soil metagenome]